MAYVALLTGLLFGASMRWAGGCAAGVWYKVGSGSLGALAAGCTVGHGLTGVPLLAPGSILAIISIFAGSAITSLWQQGGMSITLRRQEGLP